MKNAEKIWRRFDWLFQNRQVTGPLFAILAVLCMLMALFSKTIVSQQLLVLPLGFIDNEPEKALQKVIIGLWILLPPLWFPLEYCWAEATGHPNLDRLRLGQEFAEKIWAGVIAFLLTMLFAGQ